MKVPCIKDHTLAEKDFKANWAIQRKWVTIYNDICDSCDICKDSTCVFYDDTVKGTRKFIEGSCKARSTAEGLERDKEEEKFFLEFYGYRD